MPFTITHPPDEAERVEGEPFFRLTKYTLHSRIERGRSAVTNFSFQVRAFEVLPPCDAVGLLSGIDSTGLIVWSGALAFIEWLALYANHLEARLRDQRKGRAHIIELGCGSGIVAVALCALVSALGFTAAIDESPSSSPAVCVLATDGNPECVLLAQRNLSAQLHALCAPLPELSASAVLLQWGNGEGVREVLKSRLNDCTTASSVTIVSADILYDASAVPLVVSTVSEIAKFAAASSGPSTYSGNVEWWLAYTPRSLTRAANESLFQRLLDAIEEQGWTYELFDFPPGTVVTGFEDCPHCSVAALLGCILVVQVTARSHC